MKRSILSFLFLLGVVFSYAQTTIAIQSFESTGDTWAPITFSTLPCTIGNDVWNYTTNLPGIAPNHGNQFWGVRDLNGSCGGNGFETITLPNINISTFSNVILSFDYNAIGFDNNEDLKYELFFDNVSQGEAIVVNGVSGNSDNTNGWKTETVSIPNSVTNVSIILSAKCNSNNERAGFDNVILQESSISNDNCALSTTLIVGTNNTQNIVTGTNVGATNSGQLPNPSCANYQGNDIWYTAQVPANGIITVETQNAGSGIDTAIEIYTGSCNNLTQIACHDDINHPSNLYSKIDLTGLPNTTIYIRVWAWNNASSGDFNIVAYSTPSPTNNDCIDATNLIVGNSNTENIITGTTIGATDSGELPTPNCANYNGDDVWYTADVPASGLLTIETLSAGSSIDTGIAIYTGSCGNLTQIDCDDDTGSNLYSLINLTGLPNTTVFIRVWAYNNVNSGEFNIVAYSPSCPFTTRWNNSGWNNGIPNSFTTAIINNDYDTATNGSFESCNCEISSGRTVNIRANDYITVHNDLTVTGTLEVRHEGSLVMTDDDGQTSVTGTLNVHKTSTPFNQYDYMYWSSPAVNETIGNVLSASVASRIYRYETSNYADVSPYDGYDDDQNDWVAVGGSAQMSAGIGYIAMGPTSGTFPQTQSIVFNGQTNNGIIQTSINLSGDATEDQDDYNLIGNPYPSGIDADLLLNNPLNTPVVDGTIYLWTHNTLRNVNTEEQDYTIDDYATYTAGTGGTSASSGGSEPSGIIASGQGFFIEAITNGSITFNNAMRVNTGNNQLFRAPETKLTTTKKDRVWLDLFTDTGAFNQLLIGFIEGASNTIDRYDGSKIGGGYVSFYSIIDGKNFAVNGKESLTDDEIIPLGFASYVENGETLKISIAKTEGKLNNPEFDIFLKDNLLNITHNLKVKDYEFISNEKGIFNTRFELIIKNSNAVIENQLTEDQLIIIHIDNQLIISTTNNSVISSLTIYDILGRLLFNKHQKYFSDTTQNEIAVTIQHINNGTILLVNAILENNKVLTKKIILH